jgi:hypothetical protein
MRSWPLVCYCVAEQAGRNRVKGKAINKRANRRRNTKRLVLECWIFPRPSEALEWN